MFHSDFVALPGNQTHNFVARHKLCFIATSSLCLGIELVGVRVRARVRIPRQIRHSSDAAPAQIRRSSDAAPTQLRRSSGAIAKKTFILYYLRLVRRGQLAHSACRLCSSFAFSFMHRKMGPCFFLSLQIRHLAQTRDDVVSRSTRSGSFG